MNTQTYSFYDPRFEAASTALVNLGQDETKFKITKPERIGLFKLDKNREIQECRSLTNPPKLECVARPNYRSKLRSPYPTKFLKSRMDLNLGFDYLIKKKTAYKIRARKEGERKK